MKKGILILWFICFVLLTLFCGFLYIQKDHQPPEIQFSEDEISYAEGDDESVLLKGVTAIDNKDGDVTNRIHIDGYMILSGEESISINYVVRDRAGNVASISRIIPYTTDVHSKQRKTKSTANQEENLKSSNLMVLNGTEIEGLAAAWKSKLNKAGYKNVEIGNYSGEVADITTIYVADENMGEELLEIFPTGEIKKGNPSDMVTGDKTINLEKIEVFIVIGTKDTQITR